MGLDTSHGCWHGAYSAFTRFRIEVAQAAGIPLPLMQGFWKHGTTQFVWNKGAMHTDPVGDQEALLRPFVPGSGPGGRGAAIPGQEPLAVYHLLEDVLPWLPLSWEPFRHDPLCVLLDHSDCDGDISGSEAQRALAARLEELKPSLPTFGVGHLPDTQAAAQRWIDGLRAAAAAGEPVGFH